uniref:UNC93-like protein MFSD11 n=1 Tax=Haemonchus contortus TaxID=6289 RepID=A0A7I4YPN5_HAECO
MRLSPRRHEFICVFLLGAGTLFLYLSYSVQAFIGENVIHTISERYPGRIFRLAGYYGQAIHYTAFAISSLITPSIQTYVRSKWILAMGSLLFALYYVGFVQVNSIYFFISQALMGVGYSFYNNGEGAYLSEHSSSETVESNTGIETAVGHSSMFVGGGALALIFYLISPSGEIATQSYTDTQIRLIYGTLLGLNMISFVIFACLPTKEYDSIASTSPTVIPSLRKQFGKFKSAMKEVNMLLLLPFFGYMGLIVSFLIGVYPTTLAFTESLKSDVYIVALYSVGAGTAEIFGGVVLRRILLKFKDWGLVMMISTHFLAVSTALILVLLSVPEMATIQPTSESTLLIKPSRVIVVIIGFLLGMGDFTITTGRAVICQVAVPKARMQVFSMSRLYQCVLACAFLFLTPYMKTTYWVIVLGFFLITGSTTFGIVAKRTAHLRRNVVSPCEDAKSKDRGETDA